jgi:hypothetical protein
MLLTGFVTFDEDDLFDVVGIKERNRLSSLHFFKVVVFMTKRRILVEVAAAIDNPHKIRLYASVALSRLLATIFFSLFRWL